MKVATHLTDCVLCATRGSGDHSYAPPSIMEQRRSTPTATDPTPEQRPATGLKETSPVSTQHPASLTTEQVGGIAITIVEGGTGYWAQVQSYDWRRWDDGSLSDGPDNSAAPDAPGFVFYALRYENPEAGGDFRTTDVTPALIRRGWRKAFADKTLRSWLDLEDPDCTDATGADVVVQLGIFGQVVFG